MFVCGTRFVVLAGVTMHFTRPAKVTHFVIYLQIPVNEVVEIIFGVLHNISMSDSLVGRLRDAQLVPTVQKYLQAPDEDIQLHALVILAGKKHDLQSQFN